MNIVSFLVFCFQVLPEVVVNFIKNNIFCFISFHFRTLPTNLASWGFFWYCSLDCSPAFPDDKQLTLCVLRMYFIYSSQRKINHVIANYVC